MMNRFCFTILGAMALTGCNLTAQPNDAASKPVQQTVEKPVVQVEPVAAEVEVSVPTPDPKPVIAEEPAEQAAPIAGPLATAAEPEVASRVSIETSGKGCGAEDYSFLKGEPYAITFDVALPGNAVVVGKSQKLEGENPNRMIVRVSTNSGAAAANAPNAVITDVRCG